MANTENGSGSDPPAIPFIPKAPTLKSDNSQEFTLCMTTTNKYSDYKFKTHNFCNGSPEDVLEWENKMWKVMKCKPVDTTEGKFNLVEVLLEGNVLTH
eukprot:1434807-Ditylum_brightwellii.AAC.1